MVTASTRSLPSFTKGPDDAQASNMTCRRPATRSFKAGALPLYGMCAICTPAMLLNSSASRWVELPVPTEP
ncbi:hypothetical protein D3C78_1922930 [compost metagenome]